MRNKDNKGPQIREGLLAFNETFILDPIQDTIWKENLRRRDAPYIIKEKSPIPPRKSSFALFKRRFSSHKEGTIWNTLVNPRNRRKESLSVIGIPYVRKEDELLVGGGNQSRGNTRPIMDNDFNHYDTLFEDQPCDSDHSFEPINEVRTGKKKSVEFIEDAIPEDDESQEWEDRLPKRRRSSLWSIVPQRLRKNSIAERFSRRRKSSVVDPQSYLDRRMSVITEEDYLRNKEKSENMWEDIMRDRRKSNAVLEDILRDYRDGNQTAVSENEMSEPILSTRRKSSLAKYNERGRRKSSITWDELPGARKKSVVSWEDDLYGRRKSLVRRKSIKRRKSSIYRDHRRNSRRESEDLRKDLPLTYRRKSSVSERPSRERRRSSIFYEDRNDRRRGSISRERPFIQRRKNSLSKERALIDRMRSNSRELNLIERRNSIMSTDEKRRDSLSKEHKKSIVEWRKKLNERRLSSSMNQLSQINTSNNISTQLSHIDAADSFYEMYDKDPKNGNIFKKYPFNEIESSWNKEHQQIDDCE